MHVFGISLSMYNDAVVDGTSSGFSGGQQSVINAQKALSAHLSTLVRSLCPFAKCVKTKNQISGKLKSGRRIFGLKA